MPCGLALLRQQCDALLNLDLLMPVMQNVTQELCRSQLFHIVCLLVHYLVCALHNALAFLCLSCAFFLVEFDTVLVFSFLKIGE